MKEYPVSLNNKNNWEIEIYKQLNPQDKLEIVRRWLHHSIDKADDPKAWRISVEKFFKCYCIEFHPGTKQFAVKNAKRCFYCEVFLTEIQKDPMENPREDSATVDHFYPRRWIGEAKITKNTLVICCRRCNQWKGSRLPDRIITRFYREEGALEAGFSEAAYLRILGIMKDYAEGSVRDAYFLA